MSCSDLPRCNDDARRAELADTAAGANGISTIEVDPTQLILTVFFFHGVPAGLDNAHLDLFELHGGVRVPGPEIRVLNAATVAGNLELTLDRPGDFSDYVLEIHHPALDPLFTCARFNFKVDCDSPFDCASPPPSPPPLPEAPPIDYLVKDYRSFRRALLEFLLSRVPGFDETNEGDLAVTLAELFAYAGDRLSYLQDAVANEACLATARQRLSVRRHARLVDYRMHEGLSARVILHFHVIAPTVIPSDWAASTSDLEPSRQLVFETEEPVACFDEQNSMTPHTWRNAACCLPLGALLADLIGNLVSLRPGQLLLFEEVLGPVPGPGGAITLREDGAERSRRQIVRLTQVDHLTDPLQPVGQQDVTRVHWGSDDALAFSFCLERDPVLGSATLARGNLARASHGATVRNEVVNPATRTLAQGPLTWLHPIPPASGSPTWLVPPDPTLPRRARSTVSLAIGADRWSEQESLLDSGPNDPHFVVETNATGNGVLRFGDGTMGRKPPAGLAVLATYRFGQGSRGNAGADSITVPRSARPAAFGSVRNPLPAFGGLDRESIIDVQRDAPQEFRAIQYRAVTAEDYARAATGVPGISNALASFRWTGSWLTVFDSVDPIGRTTLPGPLRDAVLRRLESWRQAGYDLELAPPKYVPLEIELSICVELDYFRSDVLHAVQDALSSGYREDGGRGFFHPDNFTFGSDFYLSWLYAAVQAVPGVRAVEALTFKRLNRPDNGALAAGFIPIAASEIVRVDNNRSEPDNGILVLNVQGGK